MKEIGSVIWDIILLLRPFLAIWAMAKVFKWLKRFIPAIKLWLDEKTM